MRFMATQTVVPGPCGLCGRDPAAGLASVTIGQFEIFYCHGDDDPSPTCYEAANREWPDNSLPEWMRSFPRLDAVDHSNLARPERKP